MMAYDIYTLKSIRKLSEDIYGMDRQIYRSVVMNILLVMVILTLTAVGVSTDNFGRDDKFAEMSVRVDKLEKLCK
jgi:hypothetical protein